MPRFDLAKFLLCAAVVYVRWIALGAPYPLPKVEWDRNLTGSAFKIAALGDGSIAAAGYGGTVSNGMDFYVAKINIDGSTAWERSFGRRGYDLAYDVQGLTDNGLIITGRLASEPTEPWSFGQTDYWVLRVDSAGTRIWDASFGGSLNEEPSAVLRLSDDNYVVGGKAYSAADGTKTAPQFGRGDAWLVMIATNGSKIWDKSFGGTEEDAVLGGACTQNGEFAFAGYSGSPISGNKTASAYGGWDVWVFCLDTNGNRRWEQSFGGTGYDYAEEIKCTKEGGFIVAGYSESGISGNKTAAALGFGDAWVVRLDATGNKLWEQVFGTAQGYEAFYSVAVTDDQGFLFSGTKRGDMWIVRSDASGTMLWERTFPLAGLDRAHTVAALSGNRCVVAGILDIDGNEATRLLRFSADSPVLGIARIAVGEVTMSLNGTANEYAIESSPDLSTWRLLKTNRIQVSGEETLMRAATEFQHQFYRARLIR